MAAAPIREVWMKMSCGPEGGRGGSTVGAAEEPSHLELRAGGRGLASSIDGLGYRVSAGP